MKHFGLLITKDDDCVIADWLHENAGYFDEIVCLDGSSSDVTEEACCRVGNVHYVHERDRFLPFKTDHGLRWGAHRTVVDRHGYGGWVTLCHTDEFFYHDPRKCCQRADEQGCDSIWWYALHFVPHPDERESIKQTQGKPIHRRLRHYHWSPSGSGRPWCEFRSFRNTSQVVWQLERHGSTEPHGLSSPAEFRPAYRHFKVVDFDVTRYQNKDGAAYFKDRWQEVGTGRTGLPFLVERIEDLFVVQYGDYRRCDLFQGTFEHDWNIGEEFR